jgi:uncharacterized repeat protein (TIGR01451 family)
MGGMFRSRPWARVRKPGVVMMAVLAIVPAAAWTATVQRAQVADVDDSMVPVMDTATTADFTDLGGTATTDPGGTGGTGGTSSTGLTFTIVPASQPSLTIAKSHEDAFTRGEDGVYTITVGNAGTASPTDGTTVTVHDTLPEGLRADRIIGRRWHCTLATLTCSRSDVLPAGHGYPPVILRVDVSCTAPERVTNTATVTGGGDTTTHTATDTTTIRHHGHHGHHGHGGHDGHHDHCDHHDHHDH